MPTKETGGCLCKATRYEVAGKQEFTIQCYCRDCQQISGGGNLPLYVINRDDFTITGPLKKHARKSDSGNDLELQFCGECGSPICNTNSLLPDKVFIMAGSLDDPSIFSTNNKVYETSRQPWDKS